MVNLDAWNRLPKNMQKLMDEVAEEIEPDWRKYIDDTNASQLQVSLDGGMELVNLPPGVAEEYLGICNNVLWEEVKPQVSGETYNKLRETLLK
jgi:TRAP-type C4-dicarboxylate transport system substrate-binding protein